MCLGNKFDANSGGKRRVVRLEQFYIALYCCQWGTQFMRGSDNKLVLQTVQLFLALISSTKFYSNSCILKGHSALPGKHFQYALLLMREMVRTRIGQCKDTEMLLASTR